jgi:hypothetical protein
MFRHHRALLALTFALAASLGAIAILAQAAAPAQAQAPTVWVKIFRGTADVQYTKPVSKRDKGDVVTVMVVKNTSPEAIARLTVEEYWYDGAGNPVTGDKFIVKKALMPGEIATVVLRTPVKENMKSNQLKFSHQNGAVKPKVVAKFETTPAK